MTTSPSLAELDALHRFLGGCEQAAVPPPVIDNALSLGNLFAPIRPGGYTVLGSAQYSTTLAHVMGNSNAPFETTEILAGDRTARIAQLRAWLQRFPAFMWIRKQAALAAGFEKFQRVSKRRGGQAKFTDDLAEFRYWRFATDAVRFIEHVSKPQPTADQRRQAAMAIDKLRNIALSTSLLAAACVGYKEGQAFLGALDSIEAWASERRRKRVDAYSADRDYVNLLTMFAVYTFGDAPPTVICEVAALKVKNPDKTAITKLVSNYKRAHLALLPKV